MYTLNPDPVAGREMRGRHRFVVLTPAAINALGLVTMVPITSGAEALRKSGLTVAVTGSDTTGVAVCNQLRSFDLGARVSAGSAAYIESLPRPQIEEIISRVVSMLECA